MVVTTRGISVMKLEEVDAKLWELGWKPGAGVKLTLLEKKSVLRELIEKNQDPGKQQSVLNNLSNKNKEELKRICMELQIHLTGNETKPQLTRKIKEKAVLETSSTEMLADDTMADFGKYRGKTFEWIWSHDQSYCLWVTDTVVEEGDKCSLSLKRLAEYIENRRQQQLRASSEGAAASGLQVSVRASNPASPVPLSASRETEENPEAEIERLQKQMDELKNQLSSRRRKTTVRDTDMPNTPAACESQS